MFLLCCVEGREELGACVWDDALHRFDEDGAVLVVHLLLKEGKEKKEVKAEEDVSKDLWCPW